MKISFNWLKELVALPAGTTAAEVARRLTLAGLEVESIEQLGRELGGVRVAEVRAVRPHPGADKLRIVRLRVDETSDPEQDPEVVCGAPNVPTRGGRVAWAAPGAVLPGGPKGGAIKIGRKEVRGFDSPGMICSEKELGLSEASDGIMILSTAFPVGADLAVALGIADEVLEVNVTPNRPDALSHAGIAREVSAAFGVPWALPPIPPPPRDRPSQELPILELPLREPTPAPAITVADVTACPRYQATLIHGLRVAPSPLQLRFRLAACGVRSISNLVDVTNAVMLETGHPLHAFDLDKLEGGIVVRRALAGEQLRTLDGIDRVLEPEDIVIADGRGPVALAGVMGGARAEVSETTVNVLLEAATFDPRSVRKTAKRLGLHSEASHRFERGVDAEGVPAAASRAATLIGQLGRGRIAPNPTDRYGAPPARREIVLPLDTLVRTAGFEIPTAEAVERLRAIAFGAEVRGDSLVATVPTFRPDVTIAVDIVEEIMRLIGLDRAPARLPQGGKAPEPSPERFADRARDTLASLGLHEIVGWAFVPRASLHALGEARLAEGITVQNPISADYEVMRTSLLPGLADAAKRNLARGVADVALFEVGPTVFPEPGDAHHRQVTTAAGLLVGARAGWMKAGGPVDFFDLKHVVVALLARLGVSRPRFTAFASGTAPGFLHPGISAAVDLSREGEGPQALGVVGELHPTVARRFGVEVPAFYFEIHIDGLDHLAGGVRASATPRFPAVTRDVSFWIDATVSADAQQSAMRDSAEGLLRDIAVLEDFRDPRFVPAGKKGMLWTLTYRADDKTLTDAEVDAAHARVVAALTTAQSIQIR
ncbi:MAG TPA: phenylalanine--tRNA ligase subunit beta [Polyangia bacterium]|jgi:phenylalanyl-tRNA synthetase beta chain